MRPVILFTLLIIVLSGRTLAQTWEVPADQKDKVSPLMFTPEMVKMGETAYNKNCQSCHGIPGKDNWAKLTPPPGDLAKDNVKNQTDGEIFYKITAGKTPMPEFRNILSEEERWQVVAYIRSFHAGYVQPEPVARTGLAGRKINLSVSYDTATTKLRVFAWEKTPENPELPVAGADIALFVKRYFGNMQLGDPKTTNERGIATIDWPADLPGDANGNVIIMVRVNDPAASGGSASLTDTLTIGVPAELPSLTEQRAWWNVRDKAPLWLIFTFAISVIVVWGFIFYILYSVIGIRKM